VLIKKYPNRRLYNTASRAYVNLNDLAALIRQGEEVQVVDAKTGEDLTRVVLTQIAPPTRESVEAYSDIRVELETLSGQKSAGTVTEDRRVEVEGRQIEASPTPSQRTPNYYPGGRVAGRPVPSGWYSEPWWKPALVAGAWGVGSVLLFDALFSGMHGVDYGAQGFEQGYGDGYDQGFDQGLQAGQDGGDGGGWDGGGSDGGGSDGGGWDGGGGDAGWGGGGWDGGGGGDFGGGDFGGGFDF